jgi:hypothetical protein
MTAMAADPPKTSMGRLPDALGRLLSSSEMMVANLANS